MDGWFGSQEGAEVGYGGHGVFTKAEQVADEAFVEGDAGGVYGALVEGLEFFVLEDRAILLGPRPAAKVAALRTSRVARDLQHSLVASCLDLLGSLLEWLA